MAGKRGESCVWHNAGISRAALKRRPPGSFPGGLRGEAVEVAIP